MFPSLTSDGPIEANNLKLDAHNQRMFPSLTSDGPIEAISLKNSVLLTNHVSVADQRRPH